MGILFEQGSSRGLRQESDNGVVTFPFTIRNQLVTSLATVDAAIDNREKLLALQRTFFTPSQKGREAGRSYLIGDNHDLSRLHKFVRLLLDHRLEVYENDRDVTLDSVTYEKGKSYLIPAVQPNSALVGIIFDDKADYADDHNLGYGEASRWPTPADSPMSPLQHRGEQGCLHPVAVHSTLQQSPCLSCRLQGLQQSATAAPSAGERYPGEDSIEPLHHQAGKVSKPSSPAPVDHRSQSAGRFHYATHCQPHWQAGAGGDRAGSHRFNLAGVDLGSSSFKR